MRTLFVVALIIGFMALWTVAMEGVKSSPVAFTVYVLSAMVAVYVALVGKVSRCAGCHRWWAVRLDQHDVRRCRYCGRRAD